MNCLQHQKVYSREIVNGGGLLLPWICSLCLEEGTDIGEHDIGDQYERLQAQKNSNSPSTDVPGRLSQVRVIKQPNGRYAVWCLSSREFLQINITRAKLISWVAWRAKKAVEAEATQAVLTSAVWKYDFAAMAAEYRKRVGDDEPSDIGRLIDEAMKPGNPKSRQKNFGA